jgi:hypothetical protein
MTMRRLASVVAWLVALAVLAGAHENYRIIGTLTSVSATRLAVKTKDGETVAMFVGGDLRVTKDKKKLPATELVPGLSVVVDAAGDRRDDLTAHDVMIVQPPSRK